MIRLDHHTSPLSPHPKQSPDHKIIPWDDGHFAVNDAVELGQTLVESTGDEKQPPPDPVSLPSPPGANATSPSLERSSSLSPVPPLAEEKEADVEIPQREEEEEDEAVPDEPSPPRVEKADESRQSTPLSELSPPPDQEEEPSGEGDANGGDAATAEAPAETNKSPPAPDEKPDEQVQSDAPSQPNPHPSPPASIATPAPMTPTIPTTTPSSINTTQDPRVVAILDLNAELFSVCMLLQGKNIPTSDPRFQQYSNRLQSNLTWLATAAEQNRQGPHPILDPPPMTVDPSSADRIRHLYTELSSLFTKDVAKRQQMALTSAPPSTSINNTPTSAGPTTLSTPGTPILGNIPSHHLKRERPQEDFLSDSLMNKRRDTGEGKSTTPSGPPSSMMPPPSSIPISSSTSGSGTPFPGPSPGAGPSSMNGSTHPALQGGHHHQQPQHHPRSTSNNSSSTRTPPPAAAAAAAAPRVLRVAAVWPAPAAAADIRRCRAQPAWHRHQRLRGAGSGCRPRARAAEPDPDGAAAGGDARGGGRRCRESREYAWDERRRRRYGGRWRPRGWRHGRHVYGGRARQGWYVATAAAAAATAAATATAATPAAADAADATGATATSAAAATGAATTAATTTTAAAAIAWGYRWWRHDHGQHRRRIRFRERLRRRPKWDDERDQLERHEPHDQRNGRYRRRWRRRRAHGGRWRTGRDGRRRRAQRRYASQRADAATADAAGVPGPEYAAPPDRAVSGAERAWV
ncbi:hypothetical protein BJ912DRAFT_116553 [Pholiota molesta]|nr:hypothetical protein BJ912DRAFT_116553 [Pholiota molesta]